MQLDLFREIIVDCFAGGGGTSTGIEAAIGRPVDIAINHDPAAIAMHKANHPGTVHYIENIWEVDPREASWGRSVGLVWLSPDCTHHSKARGGKPRKKNIRGLAWVAVRWAATVKPRVIMLENVEEFQDWGPLTKDNQPDPKQKARTFKTFVNALKYQDYRVEWRELRACDYGAPTIRKRLFLIARRDGRPIVWPQPTHGDPNSAEVKSGKLLPWRTAAEIIDWSKPCPSIFDTAEEIKAKYGVKAVRPLADNTMKRIARGMQKFVIDNPNPFIVRVNYSGSNHHYCSSINAPLSTITSKNGWGIVAPTLIQYHSETASHEARGQTLDKPIMTIDTSPRYGLVAAFISKYYDGTYQGAGSDLTDPLHTATSKDHNALITSHLVKMKGTNIGQPVTEPVQTITAGGLHFGEVRAFLLKYYGADVGQDCNDPLHTITSRDRFGLVTIHGQDYQIVDIGLRMLEPRELFNAQGFPTTYVIDRDSEGNPYPKSAQVARCGNSVSPVIPKALVEVNLPELCVQYNAVSKVV